jgi:hypothetical protein
MISGLMNRTRNRRDEGQPDATAPAFQGWTIVTTFKIDGKHDTSGRGTSDHGSSAGRDHAALRLKTIN